MTGRIPQQFIDDLMSRIDIIQVIESRLPLRKAGRNFVALCPFHRENSPSFTVSPDKQFYHCFGCGAHGSAISFLMNYDRIEFQDAIKELADYAGLKIPFSELQSPKGTGQIYEMLERATHYYQDQMQNKEFDEVRSYIAQRGISNDASANFAIGFAPPGWDNLLQTLTKSRQDIDLLLAAGLIIEKNPGKYYDRFRNRIMFPIRDMRGRVVGFGGRTITEETPKYLNSPETEIFRKGQELYGCYEAKKNTDKLTRLIVVEGYMDVIALADKGISYAVGTLGTATSFVQIKQLFRLVPDVIFCFDGDAAGQKAAWRALENSLPALHEGRQIRFMFLPQGDDPDSFIRREGKLEFEKHIERSVPLSAFLYETLIKQVDMASIDGRARLVELVKPLLSKIPEGAFRQLMTAQLADIARVSSLKLNADSPQLGKAKYYKRPDRTNSPTQGIKSTGPSPIRKAIALLFHQPELSQSLNVKDIELLDHVTLPGIELFKSLLELLKAQPQLRGGALLEHWRGTKEGEYLGKIALLQHLVPNSGIETEFTAALDWIKEQHRQQRLDALLLKSQLRALSSNEKHELQTLLIAPPYKGGNA